MSSECQNTWDCPRQCSSFCCRWRGQCMQHEDMASRIIRKTKSLHSTREFHFMTYFCIVLPNILCKRHSLGFNCLIFFAHKHVGYVSFYWEGEKEPPLRQPPSTCSFSPGGLCMANASWKAWRNQSIPTTKPATESMTWLPLSSLTLPPTTSLPASMEGTNSDFCS